jgi:hypothetical protein
MSNFNAIDSSYPFETADYSDNSLTYAKFQQASAANILLGNPTAGAANYSEVTLGAGLSFVGTALTSSLALPTTVVSGTSQTMAVNNSYIANNASLVTLTLPTSAVVGSIFEINGLGAGLFKIAQGSGQQIVSGSKTTTSGSGGSLTAVDQYGYIALKCIVANNTFAVIGYVGNFTGA